MTSFKTKITRRAIAGSAIAMATVMCWPLAAAAQEYPSKPVQLIVPFGAGGGSDSLVRLLQPALEENLGGEIVVINVPGAGSVTGSRRVVDADPDGYQVLVNHTSLLTAIASGKADFTTDDLDLAASGATMPLVVVVPDSSELNTLDDLIAKAQDTSEPTIAGVNIGALNHFSLGMVENAVDGQQYRYVQTGGGADTTKALLGDHIDVGVLAGPEAVGIAESGDIKVLAALNDDRIPYLPDVPTAKEGGIDVAIGIEYSWYMPKGTPPEAVAAFAAALEKTMNDPETIATLEERGIGASFYGGDEARSRVNALQDNLNTVAAGMN